MGLCNACLCLCLSGRRSGAESGTNNLSGCQPVGRALALWLYPSDGCLGLKRVIWFIAFRSLMVSLLLLLGYFDQCVVY